MSPGGHLLTTLAACATSLFLSREIPLRDSLALAGGIAAGGFVIDVDHVVDYVLFERRRDLRPAVFLRHYPLRRPDPPGIAGDVRHLRALLARLLRRLETT